MRRAARVVAWFALALLPLAGTACLDSPCEGATADALYVTVVDFSGNPIVNSLDATADGEIASAFCTRRAAGGACSTWAVGYAQAGNFVVMVSAEGHVTNTFDLVVAPGACGPVSQSLTATLIPE